MNNWFDTTAYLPQGFCLAWDSDLVMAVVLSNGLIAFAYILVSIALVGMALERDPVMPRWFYWSLATFTLFRGLSHVLSDVTLYLPLYPWQAVELALSAGLSLIAALLPFSIWMRREAMRWRR